MTTRTPFIRKPLVRAIAALSAPVFMLNAMPALSQAKQIEEVTVTATRRAASIQDIPINIAAIGGTQIEEQGISDLAEIAKWVPGLHIVDQGARSGDMIIVRGLNLENTGSSEGVISGGGTVATYLGEVPLYIDLKLNDMQRVEALLGPQGTLYGAGSMTGAVRFIPNRPEFGETTLSVRGDVYAGEETNDLSRDFGFTYNQPISENLALRLNIDSLKDEGFIDYDFVVREPGVSDPDPDWDDPADVAANLISHEDANWEETLSARIGLRWAVDDLTEVNFTYSLQDQDVGARTIQSQAALAVDGPAVDRYTSGKRVLEPNSRKSELFSLEIVSDLGFAELTSATGYSKSEERGSRDQNDLLITLEYSYEAFPEFIAITEEDESANQFTQEIRLVSTSDSDLSWIAGGFYSKYEDEGNSKEFVPGLSPWAVANFGGIQERTDDLEYYEAGSEELTEVAIFGELSYVITDQWDVTIGGRFYDYELEISDAVDFPFFNTVYEGTYGPEEVNLDFEDFEQTDNGLLFKINTSYDFTDDLMAYLTYSEGYRTGGSNGVPLCPDEIPDDQFACALPDELLYTPDTTQNYEFGVHSTWLDGSLILNGAIYYVDWSDPQLGSSTVNASVSITKNGDGAAAKGIELSTEWLVTGNFSIRASFAHNTAELTDDAPLLLRPLATFPDPDDPEVTRFTTIFEDGVDGDRLPGSPETQITLFASYDTAIGDRPLKLDYGVSSISDTISKTGLRSNGETLDGYTVHDATATLFGDAWSASLYIKNLTNEYGETAVISSDDYIATVEDINGDPVIVRSYAKNIIAPRSIGLRFTYDFQF